MMLKNEYIEKALEKTSAIEAVPGTQSLDGSPFKGRVKIACKNSALSEVAEKPGQICREIRWPRPPTF
jgi:hypothetical protein